MRIDVCFVHPTCTDIFHCCTFSFSLSLPLSFSFSFLLSMTFSLHNGCCGTMMGRMSCEEEKQTQKNKQWDYTLLKFDQCSFTALLLGAAKCFGIKLCGSDVKSIMTSMGKGNIVYIK